MRALARSFGLFFALSLVALSASTATAQLAYVADDHVRYRPFQIGVSAVAGAQVHTQSARNDVDGTLRLGLDLLGSIAPGFAIGVTRLGARFGYSDIEGLLFGLNATPTLELAFFATAHAQLFLQAGATITIDAANARRPFGVNAAATGVLGVRWWLGNLITIGILVGADVGLTNPGIRGWFGAPLAQGEPAIFGGLELGFHL